MDPQQIAERCREVMWENDRASQWLGLTVDEVGPGRAVASLLVEERHCNGHDVCHGGFTFTLADTAFAYACNSRNEATLAQFNTISFLRPGQLGSVLRAEAEEVSKAGRSGIYDVTVTATKDGETKVIAEFRGASRAIGRPNFTEEDE
ncbi:hydroxyphenylacetyl-CoA thioesterase PaaI [Rhodovulum sp. DZ06]|uniref:hydroxyphenylacetyl-CoA thioesterase PaaI n=1 Tax=Rhodovulum sp. DZ06 TaxID=3425126 RepID=UPI003D32F75E